MYVLYVACSLSLCLSCALLSWCTVKMNGVSAQVSAESGAYVKEQDEPTRVVSKSDEQKSRIKVAIKVCFR